MKHPKKHEYTSYAIDDIELIDDDYVQEVHILSLLDEYLEDVGDGEEETPKNPQECPTQTLLKKNKQKCKDGRLWKKLCPKVNHANNIPNKKVQSVCFIDLGMRNIDSLISMNLLMGSSLKPKSASSKTPYFEPP